MAENSQNSRSKEARNRYRRGRALEYRVRDHYTEKGWLVVRAAGSKGPVDLVAIRPPATRPKTEGFQVDLIQCKRDGKLPPKERQVLVELGLLYDCTPVLAKLEEGDLILEKLILEL